MKGPGLAILLLLLPQEPPPAPPRERSALPRQPAEAATFLTAVPDHPGSVILGRPGRTSVTVSLLMHAGAEGQLVWGPAAKPLPAAGRRLRLAPGVPQEVDLEGLKADTAYHYAFLEPTSGRRLLPVAGPGTFRTARAPGQSFTFTITADSHLDGSCDLDRYRRTLALARQAHPDFHIDLGDTFMTEKHPDRTAAAAQYAAQRYWLGGLAEASPLVLVLGNHDGEGLDRRGEAPAEGLGRWSHALRLKLFPALRADGFTTTSGSPWSDTGAWSWGDALFVVLDPYWTSTPTRGGREPWNSTLGTAQVEWLARTLRASKARFKFLFIHQLTGSDHPAGRGGAEASAYQEWGGRELDGSDGFKARRPGWEKPVHDLLVETGVTAVFHGHDHFYARQTRDGITYQLVPQPAHRNDRTHHAEVYGYRMGTFLPPSGFLKVDVSPASVGVFYVRSDSTVADRYELTAAR